MVTTPWLWALPFLFTFLGGVFSDVFESRHRKLFLGMAGMVLLTQALACLAALPQSPDSVITDKPGWQFSARMTIY